jgi:hypothetical protein
VATERLDHAGDEAVPPLDGEAPRAGKRRRGIGRARCSAATGTWGRSVRGTPRTGRAEVERPPASPAGGPNVAAPPTSWRPAA